MQLAHDISSLKELLIPAAPRIFVPTMGALHRGHQALIKKAKQLATQSCSHHALSQSGQVILSIFLNPTQFGPGEDLSNYPSNFEADRTLAQELGVDLLFAPHLDEIYPTTPTVMVEESPLSQRWCGHSRPHHFRGVLTILMKLFHLISPDQVILGEKDWQQLTLVRMMVEQFFFPIEIIGVPTVRESTGLALSSRNSYLTAQEKKAAASIYQSFLMANNQVAQGERSPKVLLEQLHQGLMAIEELSIDYIGLVDERSLIPLEKPLDPARDHPRFLVACYCGQARLIDNFSLKSSLVIS